MVRLYFLKKPLGFNKFSRNLENIFHWLPGSWQQSAFSGKRCTAQFPIPQVRVPSHSSSLSQSPSWIPHLLSIVQQLQELPLLLQVSWPLQLVASSHLTTKDKREHTIDSIFWKNILGPILILFWISSQSFQISLTKLVLSKLASFPGKRRFNWI